MSNPLSAGKAIRSFFRNLRIKHKLFLLLLSVMSVCVVLTYSALQYAYSIYDHQLYLRSSQVLNLSANSIENELRRLEGASFNIVTDPTLQSRLSFLRLNPTISDYERHITRDEIVTRLVQFTGSEKYAISADLFDLSGNIYSAGEAAVWGADLETQIWSKAMDAEGQVVWMVPSSNSPALLAVRLIRSYNSNQSLDLETLGVMVLRVRIGQIVSDVSQGTELGTGELLIASDREVIYPLNEAAEALSKLAAEPVRGSYEVRRDGKHKVFISQMNSSYTNWTYSCIIAFDTIFNRIVWMKNMLILLFSACLFLLTIVAMRVARGITVPIEKLIARMKLVQKGDFSTPALPDPAMNSMLSKDEVGQLHRTFRMMVEQINELITENYAKQLIIKETQFKALQSQINPHFLYNTLESINWEAKMGGQVQISRMVESLGFLLRSSISQKESIVTIGYELDIIRHYLTIQETRFEERLVFTQEVAPHLYSCPIPKLSLQPLVENAIHHALEPMVRPCHIHISSEEASDGVYLIVEDDGPGMDTVQLEKVRRGEANTKGNGIGLTNIAERIVLAFGDPYGLRIESEQGAGTRVILHLPYERSGSHV